MEYEEHEKRAWSVDFSRTEPSMLVSGSDDCKVLKMLYLYSNHVLPILLGSTHLIKGEGRKIYLVYDWSWSCANGF